MARFEGGTVVFETTWTAVKDQIDTRKLDFRYEEDGTAYQIYAVDENFLYTTVIYKSGQAPQDQATYDTWRSDFESNYKNRVVDFNNTEPVFISNIDGYSVVLKDGATPTANDGYGVALIGYDGSNYRMNRMDSSGHQILVGAGSAGTPSGGVISIQGVSGGQAMPVSGSISVTGSVTTTNASVGSNNAAIPTSSTQVGGSDGTNLQALRVFDLDTGGGQQWVLGVGLRKASGGGTVELGTSTDPIRIDPTGTTTQPVSGTVTANQGGAWTVAATQSGTWTVQPGNTANTTPWLTTISQGGNAATVTASNALKIDGSAVTQPVSGTVTANAGTGNFTVIQSTASNLRAQLASESTTGAAIPSTAVMVGGSDGANLRSIFLDSSGRQIIIGAAANGAAVAGNPVLIAGSDGTNARSIRTATDGTVRVDPTGTTTQPVSGTVSAAQSGTWNITNISGTVSLPTGAATEASLIKLTLAQGSTTSGQTGALILGAVTTAAPSYTTGQSSPLSLDTTGALRITGSISASNPSVGSNNAAIPTSSTQIGGSDGTNLQAARVFDGDTGGGTQFILGVGLRKAASGGTVEAGTSTDPLRTDPTGTTTQPVSGTVTANQGGTWTVQPGNTANTTPWLATVSQGGNNAVVKAASTAAVAADPALVVAISPNNSISISAADVTGAGTLNALNATASVVLAGRSSVGMFLAAGTLVGTIVPEISMDGGTTWVATFFDDPAAGNKAASIVFGVSNTATTRTIIGAGGASNARVRVSAFTSGTASCTLRATVIGDPSHLFTGANGSNPLPPIAGLMAGSDGTTLRNIAVDTTGKQIIVPSNVVSTANSSTATLGIGGVFTGTFEEVKDYATISIVIRTDQASATDGLEIQWSTNSTDIDDTDTYTIPANNGKYFTFGPEARYLRIRYTNGAVAQTFFRMQVIYHYFNTKPSSHRLTDTFNDENDAELVKAVIAAKAPTGTFVNVNSGLEGSLLTVDGPNLNSIHSNSTITASGSSVLTTSFYGNQQIILIVNVKNSPTGTTPTITYTINEVDPGDQSTVLTNSSTSSTTIINAVGTYTASIKSSISSCIKVTWTVTGSSPSFTGVYSTLVSKSTQDFDTTGVQGTSHGFVALASNGLAAVRSTTYTEQASNAQRSMSSSSAVDTAAGIGARTVRITYYTSTYTGPFTTTVTLNGTTPVNTSATNICFIEKMEVATVGSALFPAGTITLFAATAGGGGAIGTITATDGITYWAHHYVAAGKTCFVKNISAANNSNQGMQFNLKYRSSAANSYEVPREWVRPSIGSIGGAFQRTYDPPQKFVGPGRIVAYVKPDQSVSAVYLCSFDFYEE